MEIRKYRGSDLEAIRGWFKDRQLDVPGDFLPKTGFIVPGVAAGFLIKTDTKACILEPFIANPKSPIGERDAALELIMGDLIVEARRLGYYRIFGFSSHRRMVSRALTWGFVKVEDSVTVMKELE